MKAVLMDREGTLIVDPSFDRVDSITKVELLPHAIDALTCLASNGYSIVIITNQTNIAQGRITESEFWHIHQYMLKLIAPSGVKILRTYICPHNSDENCECRKPKPLLLNNAIKDYGLNPVNTFMVGDRLSDIQAGVNAGIKTILVKTAKVPVLSDEATYIADNLLEAVRLIVADDITSKR